jgi:hypothetical protein
MLETKYDVVLLDIVPQTAAMAVMDHLSATDPAMLGASSSSRAERRTSEAFPNGLSRCQAGDAQRLVDSIHGLDSRSSQYRVELLVSVLRDGVPASATVRR